MWAANTFGEHALLFNPVLALFALQDKTNPFQASISSNGSAGYPEVEADKMFPGKTEDGFNPPVILHGLTDNKPEQDTKSHLPVIFSVHGLCKIAAFPCFQVCSA